MTDPTETLAAWRETTDAATEGPWEVVEENGVPGIRMPLHDSFGWDFAGSSGLYRCDDPYDDCDLYASAADREAEFIAQSRAFVPALLTAVENVLAQHALYRLDGTVNECEACGYLWPCPTVKVLADALGGSDD